jgi:hypothetical protein
VFLIGRYVTLLRSVAPPAGCNASVPAANAFYKSENIFRNFYLNFNLNVTFCLLGLNIALGTVFSVCVGSEAHTAVVMKSSVFWDITPCSLLKISLVLCLRPWNWVRHVPSNAALYPEIHIFIAILRSSLQARDKLSHIFVYETTGENVVFSSLFKCRQNVNLQFGTERTAWKTWT